MSFDLDRDDQDFQVAMDIHRRQISEEQMRKFEGNSALQAEFFSVSGLHS